jgi:hypothetical protein
LAGVLVYYRLLCYRNGDYVLEGKEMSFARKLALGIWIAAFVVIVVLILKFTMHVILVTIGVVIGIAVSVVIGVIVVGLLLAGVAWLLD